MASRKADYSPEAWERHKERERARYRNNPTTRAALAQRADKHVAAKRQFLDAARRERGCADCGTREGRLDFDHRPGEVKLHEPAHLARQSWTTLRAEIAKCDVRCVRCHGRRSSLTRWGATWGNEALNHVDLDPRPTPERTSA